MTKRMIGLALAAALLATATAAAPKKRAPVKRQPVAQHAAKDWSLVTSVAPGGGFVMGNPAAKVRLVEYSSFTCPHCAHFSGEAMVALRRDYIRTGKVAFENRNAIRDRVDLAVTLLARCDGPQRYFRTGELIFSRQDEWLPAASSFEETQADALVGKPPVEALAAVAKGAGLDTLLAARGLPPARIKACLADKTAQAGVAAMTDEAWNERHIPGTPFFLINDVAVEGRAWPQLETSLRDALK